MATGHEPPDWRESKTTVTACLNHLCMSETLADIHFLFPNRGGEDDVIPAHKFVLAMRSAVFEKMFYGETPEITDSITVRDLRVTTFQSLLSYMYSDTVLFDGNTVLHVLAGAKKYQLMGLARECGHFLETAIDTCNVCSMYNQAGFYDMDLLQSACLDYICANASEVLKHEDFLKLTPENLASVLAAGGLAVEEELDVFHAAHRWAEHACQRKGFEATPQNMRAWLAEALYQIRMPIIHVQDFTHTIVESGLLSKEEQVEVYKHVTSVQKEEEKGEKTQFVEKVGKFVATPRPGSVFEVTLPFSNIKKCLTAACHLTFMADKPLRLRKIRLIYSEQQYVQDITVTVTNTKDGTYEKPKLDPISPKGPLNLTRGVYLMADTKYSIAISCMIYRGDVNALDRTQTVRGVVVTVTSVFNAIHSMHLSRVHA